MDETEINALIREIASTDEKEESGVVLSPCATTQTMDEQDISKLVHQLENDSRALATVTPEEFRNVFMQANNIMGAFDHKRRSVFDSPLSTDHQLRVVVKALFQRRVSEKELESIQADLDPQQTGLVQYDDLLVWFYCLVDSNMVSSGSSSSDSSADPRKTNKQQDSMDDDNNETDQLEEVGGGGGKKVLLQELWSVLTGDETPVISSKRFRRVLQTIGGSSMNETETEALLHRLDPQATGNIEEDEFLQVFECIPP